MHQVPTRPDWLEPQLAQRLAGMRYAKRRQEARLGRWTAKAAIATHRGLDLDHATLRGIEIRNAPDGAPEASVQGRPLDAVIAMTDRADWAVCALLPGGQRIGCDLELVEPRSPAFVRDYFTPAEVAQVAAAADPDAVANLIWSAKESALKVLRTGLRRDTRTVEVTLPTTAGDGWQPLSVGAGEGRRFPGWWLRCGPFLLTVAAEVATDPPVSLQSAPPLHQARPAHRWLDDPAAPDS